MNRKRLTERTDRRLPERTEMGRVKQVRWIKSYKLQNIKGLP